MSSNARCPLHRGAIISTPSRSLREKSSSALQTNTLCINVISFVKNTTRKLRDAAASPMRRVFFFRRGTRSHARVRIRNAVSRIRVFSDDFPLGVTRAAREREKSLLTISPLPFRLPWPPPNH